MRQTCGEDDTGSAQLLSTAHRVIDGDEYADKVGLYKMAHKNHPSTIWTRTSTENYMCSTDTSVHCVASTPIDTTNTMHQKDCLGPLTHVPKGLTYSGFTDPPQCMPDYCKGEDTVLAYQNYYILEKSRFAKWKKRPVPEWFSGGTSDGKRGCIGITWEDE